MMISKRTIEFLGFDDRWFMLVGIPMTTIFTTMVYCQESPLVFFQNFNFYFWHGFLFTCAYWLCNRYLMISLRRRFPELKNTVKRVGLNIVFAIVIYPLISAVVHGIIDLMHSVLGTRDLPHSTDPLNLIIIFLVIFMILSIYEAVYFFKQYKKAVLAQQQLKTEHVSTQLTNLRNQVNPHFLFNSLNTLMSLIPSQAQHAHDYLRKLSSFYRYSVTERDELLVPIEKEIEVLRVYGDLVGERFGSAINIDVKVEVGPNELTLPMTLQLLVENAVKHNIVSKDDPLRILIYREADYLKVENTIQPRITETDSTGMGLKNIKERYSFVTKEQVLIDDSKGRFTVGIPIIKQKA